MGRHFSNLLYGAWLFQLFHFVAWAQKTIQNILWNVPDGDLPDLSQTFTAGSTLPLSWNNYTSTLYVDTTKNLVDLWVASFDNSLNSFSQLIKENINMSSPGNFAWTIAIPDNNLAVSAKYVLRFKASSPTFDQNSGDLSSPGFLVLRADTTSTSSSSVSSSLTPSLSVVPTILSSATPSSTTVNDNPGTSSGLSTGAKAGIGVGVAIAVLALAGIAFFLVRKRKPGRQEGVNSNVSGVDMVRGQEKLVLPSHPVEMPTSVA